MSYILVLSFFLVILLIIGIFLSKYSKTFSDYFFGKKDIGSLLIFFTITASWIGASTTIATIEKGILIGFNAIWMLGVPTFLTIFIFILLNKKIRDSNFISLPEFLKFYYGKKISFFASILVLFYMIVLSASQLVAWGKFISEFINTNYTETVLIGGLIIIIYSFFGGYLSVIFTDGIQLIFISTAILYLFFYSNKSLTYMVSDDFKLLENFNFNILMVISFTLAWIISPIIWQRIISAKTAKASKRGLLMSLITFFILYVLIIFIAISLRQYGGESTNLGSIIKTYLPKFGSVLVFIGIASAIMSTADSALNIGALTLSNDILHISSEKKKIFYAKFATVFCGILAVIIAMRFTSIIKTLGLASEIMAEGFFIPGMAALLFKTKKPLAGILSLSFGGGFSTLVFLNEYGLSLPIPNWPYSLPYGLGLSLSGFIIGYFLDKKKV